jgi:hypothetical protein
VQVALQFSTESDIISWGIRVVTDCKYSHVDLVMPDGQLLGARSSGGVAIRPPNYATFTARLVKAATVTDAVGAAIYAAAKSQLGKPYDLRAIIGLALPFGSSGYSKEDWLMHERWFCSDLLTWAFQEGGCTLLDTTLMIRITPADMLLSPLLIPVSP